MIHPGHVQTDMGGAKGRVAPVTPEIAAKGIADVAYWALGPVMTETPAQVDQ